MRLKARGGDAPLVPPEIFPTFSPAVLCELQTVVEAAWAELQEINGRRDSPLRLRLTRELLAHRVMACAARGEHDPEKLKRHAVSGMSRRRRQKKPT